MEKQTDSQENEVKNIMFKLLQDGDIFYMTQSFYKAMQAYKKKHSSSMVNKEKARVDLHLKDKKN